MCVYCTLIYYRHSVPWLCVLQKSAGMFFSFVLGELNGQWLIRGFSKGSVPSHKAVNTASIEYTEADWLDESNHGKRHGSEGVSQQQHFPTRYLLAGIQNVPPMSSLVSLLPRPESQGTANGVRLLTVQSSLGFCSRHQGMKELNGIEFYKLYT